MKRTAELNGLKASIKKSASRMRELVNERDSVRLQLALTKATALVAKSGDVDLIEDWSLVFPFISELLGRKITQAQSNAIARDEAAKKKRKISDEDYDREVPAAKSDKDLARRLKAHPTHASEVQEGQIFIAFCPDRYRAARTAPTDSA